MIGSSRCIQEDTICRKKIRSMSPSISNVFCVKMMTRDHSQNLLLYVKTRNMYQVLSILAQEAEDGHIFSHVKKSLKRVLTKKEHL